MAAARGVGLAIDAAELARFSKKVAEAAKLTKPIMATGLNTVGDDLVTVMANNIAKSTGLGLEQVRGLFKVTRANRGKLDYEITVDKTLLEPKAAREIEGQRESTDFGAERLDPGTLVVVMSKHDELVCMDCEELEAAGPMPVEVARAHIPRHPHCRCVIMPYVQKGKRLPVTMTTLSGTDARQRVQVKPVDVDMTLRQLAQNIIDKTTNSIRLELK